MVDVGNVCQPCADAWTATYATVEIEVVYSLVSNPLDCEECEGEEFGLEEWDVQP